VTDWKTTASGIGAAVCQLVSHHWPALSPVCTATTALFLALLGYYATDRQEK
jgi:hypothetical protein